MPLPFIALVGIEIGLGIVSRLLQKENDPEGATSPGEFERPTADAERAIPLVFGTCKIQPNVIWWGDVAYKQFTYQGQFRGFTYYSGVDLLVCWGPIDELLDLYFDDTRSFVLAVAGGIAEFQRYSDIMPKLLPVITSVPTEYDVDSQGLFGGSLKDGGIRGKFDFYWGTEDQVFSDYVQERVSAEAINPYAAMLVPVIPVVDPDENPNDDTISDYKSLCHIVFKRTDQDQIQGHDAPFYWGVQPQLKSVHAVVRRCPDSLAMPDTAVIINATTFLFTEKGANVAHAVYEIMTNVKWGLKMDPARFDIDSFKACAQVIFDESLGVSMPETDSRSAYDLIKELMDHVDGLIYTHPISGLISMRLIRGDYDVADLPTIDIDNSTDRVYEQPNYNDVFTGVIITFKNSAKAYADDTVQWNNQATLEISDEERIEQITLRGFTNVYTANLAAERVGRALTQPFAKCRFTANRNAFNFVKGDAFVLDWSDEGIAITVMRVAEISYGSLEDGKIEISAIEDVFYGPDVPLTVGLQPPTVVIGDPSVGESLGAPDDVAPILFEPVIDDGDILLDGDGDIVMTSA